MKEKMFQIGNAIWWDRCEDDKVYMDSLCIMIVDLPFVTRHVHLRFTAGPELDLSFFDMDRIAVEYLGMRGVELPLEVRNLINVKCPPPCDFLVPKDVVSMLRCSSSPPIANEKRCARCLQTCPYSGDWFGDLCPKCADETEPNNESDN
jgi:hypothetical protein